VNGATCRNVLVTESESLFCTLCALTRLRDDIGSADDPFSSMTLLHSSECVRIEVPVTEIQQGAELPQRDSASAMHVFPGSLTDRAMH